MSPRVLVDATAVPADRGGVGRYVDGLIAALAEPPTPPPTLAIVCQRADAERYERLAPRGPRRRRTGRHRAPPGPPRLGADRPAAGRAAGRGAGPPLAALHDAAALRPARRRHGARRDLLHRARPAQRGQGHLLPLGHPHRAAPRHPRRRPEQGDPRRGRARARGRRHPHRRRLPRRRPAHVPRADRRREAARAGPARPRRPALPRLPRHARAAQERPRRSIRGWVQAFADREDAPALVLAGGSGWDDQVDGAVAEVPVAPARPAPRLPALHRPARLPRRRPHRRLPEPRRGLRPAGARGDGLRRAGPHHASGCRCPRSAATPSPTPSPTPTRSPTALDRAVRRQPTAARRSSAAGHARSLEFTWAASAEAHLASYARAVAG